jgi:glutamate dehydrogenase (NAD(P)+)
MYALKNVVKSPLVAKEMAKVLPIALSNQRNYSGHQIPERLKDVSSAANPKFFDMVRKKN